MSLKIGPIEKKIYSLRAEHPLAIPQIDPENQSLDKSIFLAKKLAALGVQHIAVGGSLTNPRKMQESFDVFVKDFDFSIVTYVTNTNSFTLVGKENRTAIYWMSVFNANNVYYLRDVLIQGAPILKVEHLEPLPTAYVFDDRSYSGSANWLTQPNLIPAHKPEISVATALAAQYLGMRFYIMAGGSGTRIPPPISHIKSLKEKTDLFIIPTSGIRSEKQAKDIFAAGADAIHVGQLIEQNAGLSKFKRIFESSKKYSGKDFLG